MRNILKSLACIQVRIGQNYVSVLFKIRYHLALHRDTTARISSGISTGYWKNWGLRSKWQNRISRRMQDQIMKERKYYRSLHFAVLQRSWSVWWRISLYRPACTGRCSWQPGVRRCGLQWQSVMWNGSICWRMRHGSFWSCQGSVYCGISEPDGEAGLWISEFRISACWSRL